ncbi:hypothetical protein C5D13_00015 [Rathayibacter toxicus]|nr:hypothetical protein C5D13_00015 [Rathayibacter toxicus]
MRRQLVMRRSPLGCDTPGMLNFDPPFDSAAIAAYLFPSRHKGRRETKEQTSYVPVSIGII